MRISCQVVFLLISALISMAEDKPCVLYFKAPLYPELARQAQPKLLVLYHYSGLSREELFDDTLARYSGHFVIGRDLDSY